MQIVLHKFDPHNQMNKPSFWTFASLPSSSTRCSRISSRFHGGCSFSNTAVCSAAPAFLAIVNNMPILAVYTASDWGPRKPGFWPQWPCPRGRHPGKQEEDASLSGSGRAKRHLLSAIVALRRLAVSLRLRNSATPCLRPEFGQTFLVTAGLLRLTVVGASVIFNCDVPQWLFGGR